MVRRPSDSGFVRQPISREREQPPPERESAHRQRQEAPKSPTSNGSGAVSSAIAIQRILAARPAAVRPADILALQRVTGNRSTMQWLAARGGTSAVSNDRIHEAAAEVMQTPPLLRHVQQIQETFGAVQRRTNSPATVDVPTSAMRGTAAPATSLPFAEQIQMSFGPDHDVSSIQAHIGGVAAEAAGAIGASAYAMGNHTVFAAAPDLHTAAHEAAHVIQQRGSMQLAGGIGHEGDSHERHAEAVADLVVQGRSGAARLDEYTGTGSGATANRPQAAPPGSGAPRTLPSVVQMVRSGYKVELPPEETHHLSELVIHDEYPQGDVDEFVKGLKRKNLSFYDSTTATLLESKKWPSVQVPDPFGGVATVTLWQCPNCKQPTTYQGIDRGHKVKWKEELKKAGVRNKKEAQIVYNNLLNLQIECRACNVSHAFERGPEGYVDVPTQKDLVENRSVGTSVADAKKAHEKLTEKNKNVNLDEYKRASKFIDNTYIPETVQKRFDQIELWPWKDNNTIPNRKSKSRVQHKDIVVSFETNAVKTRDYVKVTYAQENYWARLKDLDEGELVLPKLS